MAIAEVPFRERQRRAREDAILDAAEELLAERGYHDMAMDDIAARVGVAKGTIYLHFPSKEALAAALMRRGIEDLIDYVAGLDPRQPALLRLGLVLHDILARRARSPRLMRDDFGELMRVIAANDACSALFETLYGLVTALVDEGKKNGEVDPALDSGAATGALFALCSPRSYHRVLAGGATTMSALNESIVRLYLRGIAREGVHVPSLEEE